MFIPHYLLIVLPQNPGVFSSTWNVFARCHRPHDLPIIQCGREIQGPSLMVRTRWDGRTEKGRIQWTDYSGGSTFVCLWRFQTDSEQGMTPKNRMLEVKVWAGSDAKEVKKDKTKIPGTKKNGYTSKTSTEPTHVGLDDFAIERMIFVFHFNFRGSRYSCGAHVNMYLNTLYYLYVCTGPISMMRKEGPCAWSRKVSPKSQNPKKNHATSFSKKDHRI